MRVRVLCIAIVGAWSFASSAQTVKRLDQVSNVRVKSPAAAAPARSAQAIPFAQASQLQRVQPPAPTGREQPPPAKVAAPAMKTGLDEIYGVKLCQVVSADPNALAKCVNEARAQMGELNPFQIALRICNRREGRASVMPIDRSPQCFGQASLMIRDYGFQERAAQCRNMGVMGPAPNQCLRDLFTRENQRVQTSGAASSSSVAGATSFRPLQR